jgi:pilus assembly protein CpaB
MKPKTLVLMGVAIACGLGASYMTSRLLAERNTEEEPKVTVLVAKKNLNMGETIRVPEDLFQEKRFTRGEEPPGAIEKYDDLKNRILRTPRRTGDTVSQEDLISDLDSTQMSVFLPVGHRAVGVRVNVETGAFGFACAPLSRVDVIGTFRRGDDKGTFSRVLLENVLVLAADDKTKRDDNGKPMPSQVVTLALKPEEALKVRLAGELGTLSLMLRKINESAKVGVRTLTYEALKKGEEATEDVEKVEPKPAPKVEPKVAKVEPKPPVVEPAGKVHKIAIHEGGRTRYVEFRINEKYEVIDSPTPNVPETPSVSSAPNALNAPNAPAEPPHPPRPTEAVDPEK